MKRIISILLALAMVLTLALASVSCNSFSTLEDDDDDSVEEKTTAEKTEDSETETEKGTDESTGEETTSKRPGNITEDTTEGFLDYVDENAALCYDEKSHKCEYYNHKCNVCDSIVCIDDDCDYYCDVCGLQYSSIGDGICAISGYGNHEGGDVYLPRYVGDKKVVEISRNGLARFSYAENIYIPDGIVAIRDSAFYYCRNLSEVYIPDSVAFIGERVFGNCEKLMYINVSEGNSVYKGDNGALYTKDGRTLKAFCAGSAPGYVDVPEGVVRIENYAFDSCRSITRIKFPDSLIKIGDWAFNYCGALVRINIPANVSTIGENLFVNSREINSILVDENNVTFKDIDGNLYTKDGEALLQYAIGKDDELFKVPEGVTAIGKKAFAYSKYIETVEIPEGVEVIDDEAFISCSVKTVMLPSTLEIIGDDAFYDTNVVNIYIPKNVSYIGFGAFGLCSKLVEISVHSDNQYYASFEGNLYSKDMTTFIAYALGKTDAVLYIPEGVTEISEDAMCDAENLFEIVLPDGVENIGARAFSQCESLKSITIPVSIDTIGHSAFEFVENLESIYFNGTTDQWRRIDKNDDDWGTWDEHIEAYTVYCNDGEISGGYNT